MIKCILCNTEKVSFYDDYKFHVINDKKYFGETKIYSQQAEHDEDTIYMHNDEFQLILMAIT